MKTSPLTQSCLRSNQAISLPNCPHLLPRSLNHGPPSNLTLRLRSSPALHTGSLPNSWPSTLPESHTPPCSVRCTLPPSMHPHSTGSAVQHVPNSRRSSSIGSVRPWVSPPVYLSSSQQGGGGVIQGSASEAIGNLHGRSTRTLPPC